METSRKLLIFTAIIAFVFALLVLFDLLIRFRAKPNPGHQVEYKQQHEARMVSIQYKLLLILDVIAVLLILSLIVLASHGGCSTACVIILVVSLVCLNNYQWTVNWFLLDNCLFGWPRTWNHAACTIGLLSSFFPLIGLRYGLSNAFLVLLVCTIAAYTASDILHTISLSMTTERPWILWYILLSRLIVLQSAVFFLCWAEFEQRHDALFLMAVLLLSQVSILPIQKICEVLNLCSARRAIGSKGKNTASPPQSRVVARSAASLSDYDARLSAGSNTGNWSRTTIGSLEDPPDVPSSLQTEKDPIPLGHCPDRETILERDLAEKQPGEESQQQDTQGKVEQGKFEGWCVCCAEPRNFADGRCEKCGLEYNAECFRIM